jgi:hypothetical protein
MQFENVTIAPETTHKVIKHLNYTSPTFSSSQNSSSMTITDCKIIDFAYLSELGSYGTTTVSHFGILVKAQNSLPTTNYNVYLENINWNGEGAFVANGLEIQGSSSTPLYIKNSTLSLDGLNIYFNPFYINYQTIAGSVYSTKNELSFIKSENTASTGYQYKSTNYVRVLNFKELSQDAISGSSKMGGCASFYWAVGSATFELNTGSFLSEKVNNLTLTDLSTNSITLNDFNCNSLEIADATYGAFRYTGTVPVSRIYYSVTGSSIKNVKQNASLQYAYPAAPYANINSTYFANISGIQFASNALALSGGLVPGCYYYNLSTNVVTVVV